MKQPGFQPKFIFGRPNPHTTDPEPAYNSNLRNTSVSDIAGSFVSSDQLEEARSLYGDNIRPFHIPVSEGVSRVLDDLSGIGNPFIVGGTVRDSIRGFHKDINDIDIEVHETNVDEITDHMRDRGYMVDEVGKQFGVLKIHKKGVVDDLDISVPRRENRTGAGHRSFDVDMDENMSLEEASERRDFTINAIMYDPELQVLVDHHCGVEDLSSGTLRHVSDKFSEDPLRVIRGFQFAGRFDMTIDPETAQLCQSIKDQYHEISTDRVQKEWTKFYEKSVNHNAGLKVLQDTGWDDTIPGLKEALASPGLKEQMSRMDKVSPENKTLVGSTLISMRMSSDDRKHFLGSTVSGKDNQRLVDIMVKTTESDMSTSFQRKNIAHNLARTGFTFSRYLDLATATGDKRHYEAASQAVREGLGNGPEKDLFSGKDLLSATGRKADNWVGEALKDMRELQYRGEFTTREGAVKAIEDVMKKYQ